MFQIIEDESGNILPVAISDVLRSGAVSKANIDHFVRSIGHLILMKVDLKAARRRNLTGTAPEEGIAHETPHRSRSRNSGAGESRHGA